MTHWGAPPLQDFDLYWASVHNVRGLFNAEGSKRLREGQVVNHFPNHYELTRKDAKSLHTGPNHLIAIINYRCSNYI